MDWKLTLAKGLVAGGLVALGVWVADVQAVQLWWCPIVALVLETARDLLKARFGAFAK